MAEETLRAQKDDQQEDDKDCRVLQLIWQHQGGHLLDDADQEPAPERAQYAAEPAGSQSFQPYTGFDFVIVMYAGVVLGGLGSVLGAFWGGLVIGIVQQMSTLVLPYQLQNTAIFVVFLLIIFLRPQGMFGRLSERT